MARFFNTAGPVRPAEHYCIDPLRRIDLPEVLTLLAQGKYLVLHAPRQTGKSSCLLALRDHLNASGQWRCVYANVEAGQAGRDDVESVVSAMCAEITRRYRDLFGPRSPEPPADFPANARLNELLSLLAEQGPQRPLVMLIDEIDALVGDSLISVLRQIRAGYDKRPQRFPQSIVLCGVRDVRDYRLHGAGQEVITGAAPSTSRPSRCAWAT